MTFLVTVQGQTGANVVATNGDTLNLSVGAAPAASAITFSPAGSPGGQGPAGPAGPSNSLSIGTVVGGESAAATITGTSPTQVLNLVLPKGDTGATGPQGPQGETGATGPAGPAANLSDATPASLGTAAAGVSTTAARGDHVHAMPTYSDVGAAAAIHSHDYVTSLNSLTGGLTLAAGDNVTITPSGTTITIAATGGGGGGIGANDAVDGGDYVGTVNAGIQITTQPTGGTATAGTAFAMSVTASYLTAISYQWQRRVLAQNSNVISSPQWVTSVDRTTASTSWTEVAYGSYEYRCLLSAPGTSSVTSSVAAVTVDPEDVIAITQQPDAIASEAGYYQQSHEIALTLSVAASYPLPISYQWQYRITTNSSFVPYPVGYYPFVDAEGATTASFAFSAPDYPYEYEYRCVLTADSTPPVISNSVRVRWI